MKAVRLLVLAAFAALTLPATAQTPEWIWHANGGKAPHIIYSTVPDADSLTTAQYLQKVWSDAGIEVEIKQIEQSTLIVNALFGAPDFDAFGWRNHGGVFVDNTDFCDIADLTTFQSAKCVVICTTGVAPAGGSHVP